jgi:HAD superfamily hydrolase (TIGR01450 family)
MISTSDEVLKIFEGIKLVAFDMDGVLRIGNHPVTGAGEIFKTLERLHRKSLIITNECRYTPEEIIEDLEEMGIILDSEKVPIITAGKMVYHYIFEKYKRFPEEHISLGIIGEQGLYNTLSPITQLNNVEIVETPPKYKTKSILVIGTVNKIKISNLEKVLKWVKSGAKIILTCADMSDPSSKGDFTLGMPKQLLHMTNYNVQAPPAYSCGKPNPLVAKEILSRFPEIKPEEVLLVGDTLYTDIRLAEENGFKSLLVLSGNTKKEGVKSSVTEADLILDSVENLEKILLKTLGCGSPH